MRRRSFEQYVDLGCLEAGERQVEVDVEIRDVGELKGQQLPIREFLRFWPFRRLFAAKNTLSSLDSPDRSTEIVGNRYGR